MSDSLSPQAQAVLDAFGNATGSYAWVLADEHRGIAAALRAAAHHLQRHSPWPNNAEGIGIDWSTSELHDIAHELEAAA